MVLGIRQVLVAKGLGSINLKCCPREPEMTADTGKWGHVPQTQPSEIGSALEIRRLLIELYK